MSEVVNRNAPEILQHPGVSVEPAIERHPTDDTATMSQFFDHTQKSGWLTDHEMICELAAHLYAARTSKTRHPEPEDALLLADAVHALQEELTLYLTEVATAVIPVPHKHADIPW
jgi:hypothetical protein